MNAAYVLGFLLAFFTALVVTPLVRKLALTHNVGLDHPTGGRKIHTQPIPRVGGIAIFLAFLLPFLLNFSLDRRLFALLGGVLIMFVVGLIDDVRSLGAWHKLFWQVIAAGVVLAGGIGIIFLSNPFGDPILLDFWRIPVEVLGFEFNILPIANFVSIVWIVGLINTINFLDGLDGLVVGISSIAAIALFLLALTPLLGDTNVALLAIILLGALLGFLPYNFFPSTIFLGDSGAYVIGMLLAALSIYAGSKLTIGALVLGLAILDAVWAVVRRLLQRRSPFSADRGHMHHVLHDAGLSQRQVVLILYVAAIMVAVAVLFAGAVFAFTLMLLMLVIGVSGLRIYQARQASRT